MKTSKTLIFLLSFFFTISSFSQKKDNIKLTILVKDGKNKPIPGAVILLDDIKQKRVANSAGYFKIKLDKAPKKITAFSPVVGVKTVDFKGKEKMVINIISRNDSYATDTNFKKAVDPIQFRNIYDYLRGKVSGVTIGLNNTIRIRGASTFNGGRAPLLILNGVQVDNSTFGDIVPTTIMSVKVLKGPETSAYGLRGANGVIEVTTTI